jgi:16S rRNA (guanine527-N7)-methyltransferase
MATKPIPIDVSPYYHRPPMTDATPPGALAPPSDFFDAAASLGVAFEPGDVERLGRFLALLLEGNARTNLTAITDPAQAWSRHILDALSLVPVLASIDPGPAAGALSVIDIGSGGGVPALPLAIVMPEVRFTLVEATGKKVAFLSHVITTLGLTNARVLQDRAERLGQDHKTHRERYDAATARALGHLAVVAELCGPLVRPGGYVVAVKGAKAEQELAESAKALGIVGLRHAQTVSTPTGRLVLLEKTIRTPRMYPRKDGEPARLPLGVPTAASAGSPKSGSPPAD